MRLACRRIDSLPRLAWCARLVRGADVAHVLHGAWVERFGHGFCEGAWDGPFPEGGFAEAVSFTGTGARVGDGAIVFVAATNSQERLHLLRRGEALFVSNSLAFALAAAGDAPDPRFHQYEAEFMRQGRAGIFRARRSLPARDGRVVLHECANLVVTPDLAVRRVEKPAGRAPEGYADYVDLLGGSMQAVLANASDPRRIRAYRPLATLSKGYDSNALAVLLRAAGGKQAATFSHDEPGVPDPRDDGSEVGELLGFEVLRLARKERPERRPCPEAEFCICPPGGDRTWLAAEDQLEGRVLVTGRHGDIVLSLRVKPHSYNLARSDIDDLGGATMNEYRLRAGYLNYAPWFTAWQHVDAIRAISLSEAMRPWSVGGRYDRPIARRILEEAGVPRDAFGQRKRGGAYEYLKRPEQLCPDSLRDFEAFWAAASVPRSARLRARALKALERQERRLHRLLWRWSGERLTLPRLLDRHHRVSLRQGFLFHWAFARVAERYRLPARPWEKGAPEFAGD